MLGAVLTRMMARRGCNLMNSRQVDRMLTDWAEDAEFIYPGSTRASGRHRGKGEVHRWWTAFFAHFPESHFNIKTLYVDKLLSMTASNRLAVEWEVVVRDQQGREFRNHGVSLVDVQGGKVVRFEDFIFDQEALARAWGDAPA